MQFVIGTTPFLANSTTIASHVEMMTTDAKLPYGYKISVKVTGYLESSVGQVDIAAQMLLLNNALQQPNPAIYVLLDDGITKTMLLDPNQSISGIVVNSVPDYPTSKGAEYANQRYFEFSAWAEFPLSGSGTMLLKFKETLTIDGGGPIIIAKRAIVGPLQIQQVWPATEYTARQTGMAVGYQAWPIVPLPLFPNALAKAPTIARSGPDKSGPRAYVNYEVHWDYQFISATPLIGVPSIWPAGLFS